jgi:spore maturation protein CgeB
MAKYAGCSDILIHVQTTDQLSSKMLQEMYAGSVVIAGSWLPYQQLFDDGIYFVSIDSIDELADTLTYVIGHLDEYKEKCKGNKDKVYKMSSWNNVADKWMRMWNEELLG